MIGLLCRRNRPYRIRRTCRCIHGPAPEKESQSPPKYPDIPETTDPVRVRIKELREKIRTLDSVEEKAYYVNLPKYYGWYSLSLRQNYVPYDSLDFLRSVTCTKVINDESSSSLPDTLYYAEFREKAGVLAEKLIEPVKAYISDYYGTNRQRPGTVPTDRIPWHEPFSLKPYAKNVYRDKIESEFICGLNRLLESYLVRENPNLLTHSQTDVHPRLESFWFKGGFKPDKRMIQKRRGTRKTALKYKMSSPYNDNEESIYAPYDRSISYTGTPILQLRYKSFIPEFRDLADSECERKKSDDIPEFEYDPRTTGNTMRHIRGKNIFGVWTGSGYHCPSLSYVSMRNDAARESSVTDDDEVVALCKAIQHSFATTMAASTFFGFTTFNNPTYPICTQTILTSNGGSRLSLAAYQLNRTELYEDDNNQSSKTNLCWFVPSRELFIQKESEVCDVNIELLRDLIALYLVKPSQKRVEEEEFPYLHEKYKYIHRARNTYEREYFWKEYLKMNVNNTEYIGRPEIQPWQKIHLIDNPNSLGFLGPRERPFFQMAKISFKGKEHWHPEFRKLDYYQPPYLPAKFRKDVNPFRPKNYRTKKVTVPVSKE